MLDREGHRPAIWPALFVDADIFNGSFEWTGIECPMPRFSRFHVLYSGAPLPAPGRKFRQIVAGPSEDGTFHEVRIFEGDSVQKNPDFNAIRSAEYYSHDTAEAADKDADHERDRSLAAGWVLYDPAIH